MENTRVKRDSFHSGVSAPSCSHSSLSLEPVSAAVRVSETDDEVLEAGQGKVLPQTATAERVL